MPQESRTKKSEVLRIRCTPKTFRRFKKVAVTFDTYEDALKHLLGQYSKIEDEDLIDWLDEKIEDGDFRSKSDAFERGLRYLKSKEPKPF